jgi:hypothetical protein
MRCFLATYRPLIKSAGGRRAAKQRGLPPFIDGSCRREPDFEARFPSITATCRGGNFAPRLDVGDRVAYLTVKGRYMGDEEAGWRLVAVLRVMERFGSHDEAAIWYRRKGVPLPSNCLVDGNPPEPFEITNASPPAEVKTRVLAERDPRRTIRLWDATYRRRISRWPVFLACEAEFLELKAPPRLSKKDMTTIFGRIPSTLNPPRISCGELEHLIRLATVAPQSISDGSRIGRKE